jgi:hypothetical protein
MAVKSVSGGSIQAQEASERRETLALVSRQDQTVRQVVSNILRSENGWTINAAAQFGALSLGASGFVGSVVVGSTVTQSAGSAILGGFIGLISGGAIGAIGGGVGRIAFSYMDRIDASVIRRMVTGGLGGFIQGFVFGMGAFFLAGGDVGDGFLLSLVCGGILGVFYALLGCGGNRIGGLSFGGSIGALLGLGAGACIGLALDVGAGPGAAIGAYMCAIICGLCATFGSPLPRAMHLGQGVHSRTPVLIV